METLSLTQRGDIWLRSPVEVSGELLAELNLPGEEDGSTDTMMSREDVRDLSP